ncbi:MAG: hypothetical protein ACR2QB_05985 [Gammaproteobacteria bacterium]
MTLRDTGRNAMMPGDKDDTNSSDDLKGLEQATGGYDPYLSDLINGSGTAPHEERRSKPRDTTPARRRAVLASGNEDTVSKTD